MKRFALLRAALFTFVGTQALAGCGQRIGPLGTLAPGPGTAVLTASSKRVSLPFDPADFASPVDNPYFPLEPGTIWTYRGVSKKGGGESNVVEVTHQTKSILGVTTLVVHDRVYIEDGSLSEDTFDWYAADRFGNVWYFGEDTKEFDHGVLVTTAGSWEAGQGGARPGLIMLGSPKVGDLYNQEDAPGVVEDMGRVVSLNETVTVPTGTYSNCLETTEWTPIEPGIRSHKFYASGVGPVLEVATRQGGERVELVSVEGR